MKRGGPLKRTGRLARRTPIRKKNPRTGGHRFRHLVNEAFREYVRGLPCVCRGPWWSEMRRCGGPVEACHVKTRGSGGPDAGNLFPACHRHHEIQHRVGIKTFQEWYSVDLPALASRTWDAYREAPGAPTAGDAA